jgi:hypothetical protein
VSGLRFDGWVPFRLYWQGNEPGVEWLYMGANRFLDPFFEATIYFEAQTPFNQLFRFRTPLAALEDWHAASPGVKPAGFIFHLSRCGSTLIARMLAALPRHIVLSEPGVLDRVLQAHERAPEVPVEQRVRWLQWLVSALGQTRTGEEQRLFIKFAPQCIRDLPLVSLAFPDVPWIFVYRDPVEVMVSNLRSTSPVLTRGYLGPGFLNFDASLVPDMDDAEYVARILGMLAETAAGYGESAQARWIEYRQLPDAVWGVVQRHFGLDLTAAEIEPMKEAAGFDAKHPERPFAADSEAKRREASASLCRLAERWIQPHYRKLEELRRAETAGFPAFRRFLLRHPAQLDALRGLERDAFFRAALQVAGQAGIALEPRALELALAEARAERHQRLL